jgi:hypothetical protein
VRSEWEYLTPLTVGGALLPRARVGLVLAGVVALGTVNDLLIESLPIIERDPMGRLGCGHVRRAWCDIILHG